MNNSKNFANSIFLLAVLLLSGCINLVETPLIDAAKRGDTLAVKTLLDNGANVNDTGACMPALMWAADKGNAEMVKLLLSKGADPNQKVYYSTALSSAANNNHLEVIDILLDNGANIDWALEGIRQCSEFQLRAGVSDAIAQKIIKALVLRQKAMACRNGWAYYHKGEVEKGITAFRQAIQQSPTDYSSFTGLSACHYKLGQYNEAVTAAKQAIALNPQWALGHGWLGKAYWYQKQYGEAEKEIKLAIDLDQNPKYYRLLLIKYYFEMAQYQEALVLGKKLAGILPENSPDSELLQYLCGCHFAIGEYDEAIADADRYIKQVTQQQTTLPNASWGYGMKSRAWREKGDSKQANENARKAMELNPADENAQTASGIVAIDNGQFAEAIKILSIHPTNNIILATAYAKNGQFDAAAKLYQECDDVRLQKAVPMRKTRQMFLAAMRPYTQKLLENAKQLEASQQPDAALAELAKAVAVAEDEQVEEVRNKMFKLARKTQPKEPEDAYRYAKRGDILVGEGNPQGAISEYNKALKMAPYSPRLYFNAALIHGSLKNYASAMEYMKTYVQLVPSAPNIQAAKDALIEWELKMEIR